MGNGEWGMGNGEWGAVTSGGRQQRSHPYDVRLRKHNHRQARCPSHKEPAKHKLAI
jgi:hypothetical protein